ncbi:MAG: ABC transporter permease [Bacteroidota bacterium]
MPSSSFQRFVALRYLRGAQGRDEGQKFLRFVTYVAVGGVTIGVAALLLSLMIVRGFSREIEEKIVGFGSHVRVESYVDGPLAHADSLTERLGALPGVEQVTPVIDDFALLRSKAGIDGAVVSGAPEGSHAFLAEQVRAGGFSFAPDSAGRPGVVVGRGLADLLAVEVGSQLTAFSMQSTGSGGGATGLGRPRVRALHVAGVYETGLADFDEVFAYTSLEAARRLFDYGEDEVTRFELRLDGIDRADETAETITETFGLPVFARSIYQVQQNLFAWINLQQSIVPLVIGVIVLVAAFNIIGTLLMVTIEKTREIGIILSMGCPAAGVKRLFVWLGFMIGVAGTTLGSGLALGLALLQLRFGIIPLPQEAYYIDTAPVELSAVDFVVVAAVALLLCTLSAYIPARVAANVDPIRSIRFAQ